MTGTQERIGQIIGDYHLLHLLGRGTFGAVYQAEHLHDHTLAAVKILHIPLTGRNALHTFLNEARTVRLRHPHIVPILDFGLSRDDLPYLVMTYADGGSLRDHHPKGSQLSNETIDTYVQQLASALQYAHDHRIIHRDVKPENMLVCSDGTVQLSDFGIAKISEQATVSTQSKVIGTAAYAAPEQSQGKPCPASDQYALAVVVYEWLTGQRPFQGDLFAVMLHHRIDEPPSPRNINPGVSPLVEQVILKALAKAPEDRFPTITHFAQALHIALQDAIPTQRLSNQDLSQITTAPLTPASLQDIRSQQKTPAGASLSSAKTPLSSQTTPPSSIDTSAIKPIEILRTSRSNSQSQKRRITCRVQITLLLALSLVLILGGGLFGVAQRFSSSQPEPVASSHIHLTPASLKPNATATVGGQATAIAQANLIVSDPLTSNIHGWPVGQLDTGTYTFENGVYDIKATSGTNSAVALLPNPTVGEQFVYTISIAEINGLDNGTNPAQVNTFGLLFRFSQPDNQHLSYYAFLINPNSANPTDKGSSALFADRFQRAKKMCNAITPATI